MSATPSNYGAVWGLTNPLTGGVVPKTEGSFPVGKKGPESVIGPDGRTIVDPKDFADGGKYRCEISFSSNTMSISTNDH